MGCDALLWPWYDEGCEKGRWSGEVRGERCDGMYPGPDGEEGGLGGEGWKFGEGEADWKVGEEGGKEGGPATLFKPPLQLCRRPSDTGTELGNETM